jgi:hypothetical protein
MEWLILFLIVPVIVVPVVVLYGYAGCTFHAPLPADPEPPADPTNLRVTDIQADSVTLEWDYLNPSPDPVTFEIQRDGVALPPSVPPLTGTTHTDSGLEPETTYAYRVTAIRSSDNTRSGPSNEVMAATLPWETVFTTAGIPPNPGNGDNQANNCIVQRINGLARGGRFVRVTLRGIVNETTVLTAVTVSRAVPAGSPQPYNSADAPKTVTFAGASAVTLLNGEVKTSDKVAYDPPLVQGQDLLVAFNVGAGSGRILRRIVTGALAFIGNNLAEAAAMNRSAGYNTQSDRVYCIELIEVA